MHFSTEWPISSTFSKAVSHRAFRYRGFSPRQAPSAVISSLALQSNIRSDRESGENPAKTIECTAPMRAQANIAMGSSRIIGM